MRTIGLLGLLLFMALIGGVLAARWRFADTPADRVYSALEIHTLLAQDPSALAGRTVLVRGQAIGPMTVAPPVHCPPGGFCGNANEPMLEIPIATIDGVLGVSWTPPGGWDGRRRALYPPPSPTLLLTATASLATTPPGIGGLLGHSRPLPDIGGLWAHPQRLVWTEPRIYRLWILPHRVCVMRKCYDAVLPDTTSPADRQIAFDSTDPLAPRFGP